MNDPHSTHTARTLVRRAQAGDEEAFERLYAAAAPRLRMFVRLRLGQGLRKQVDSGDVVQETLVAACRDFDRFECRDADAFARWLCCIAENRIRGLADHHGAAKRQAAGGLQAESALKRVAADATGPVTAAARVEAHERLGAALEALEPDARELLLLRHFQGRTIDEIARITDLPPTTVRRRIGAAQIALGQALRDGGERG